jgi:hypothetical protein
MRDDAKRAELPPHIEPMDATEGRVKERQARPDALRHAAIGAETPAAAQLMLLGSASAAVPANAEPLAGMVEHLQQQYGNAYVQHLLSQVRAPKPDEASPDAQRAPTTQHHAEEIARMPAHGTIDAAGRFSVAYAYDLTSGGDFLPLMLVVPAGVTVTALPLTSMMRNDYRIADPGSMRTRVVILTVSIHVPTPPKMQIILAQGNFGYVVVFHFRRSSIPPPAPEGADGEEGDTEE